MVNWLSVGDLLNAMTDSSHNFFVARCNLFDLAAETMPQPYEEVLHVARMNAVHFGMPHELALQKIHDVLNYRQKMKADGCLSRTPQI